MYIHEFTRQIVTVKRHFGAQRDGQVKVFFGRAQPVYARYGTDDDYVVSFAKTACRAVSEFIDFVVDFQLLFDVSVASRDIRFGLIVVVIRYEKLHAVIGEKLTKLVAKLRRKRFVVRDNERGTLHPFDDVCHRKGFAASRNAQKHLRTKPVVQSLDKFFDCLFLIAVRSEFRF